MSNQLVKQRVVGALVLIALVVILVPIIQELGVGEGGIFRSNIPPRPDGFEVEIQSLRGSTGAVPELEQLRIVDNTKPEAGGTPAPTLAPQSRAASDELSAAAKGTPATAPAARLVQARGWVVQVGSFSDPKNALALRDKVRGHGLAAFAERRRDVSEEGRPTDVVRVFVGPELSREEAEALKRKLKEEARLDGLVIEYR